MPVSATGSIASVTTAETAIASTQAVLDVGNAVKIGGVVYFTGNATASTVTLNIRRGTGTGGTSIWTSSAISVAASAVKAEPFEWIDSSPGTTETYTITATFSGAPTGAVSATISLDSAQSVV